MKIAAKYFQIEVREGTSDDIPLLMSFIKLLAEFEKIKVQTKEEDLHESLFGKHPVAHTLLAFVDSNPAAYMIYYFTFSTMIGKKSLWLEDLFVKPEYRGNGLGRALMAYMKEIAIKNDCGRFEWAVLGWNKTAIDFYTRMGADILNEWRICRIDGTKLAETAKNSEKDKGD